MFVQPGILIKVWMIIIAVTRMRLRCPGATPLTRRWRERAVIYASAVSISAPYKDMIFHFMVF